MVFSGNACCSVVVGVMPIVLVVMSAGGDVMYHVVCVVFSGAGIL